MKDIEREKGLEWVLPVSTSQVIPVMIGVSSETLIALSVASIIVPIRVAIATASTTSAAVTTTTAVTASVRHDQRLL